jgi:hypothetical protein
LIFDARRKTIVSQARRVTRCAENDHKPQTVLSSDMARRDGLRQQQLARQPLCERCLSQGKTTPTPPPTISSHNGNRSFFIDPANHESACKEHYHSTIKAEENRGDVIETDVNGRPIDPIIYGIGVGA